MRIPIKVGQKTIYLQAGDGSYELAEQREVKDRNDPTVATTQYVPFKYYSNLEVAFGVLLDMKVRECDATTLGELKEAICQAREELRSEWKV